jgi:hypothetical protein
MNKQQRSRLRPRRVSTVRTEITSEGWKMYPEDPRLEEVLAPLRGLAEVLGWEVHIVRPEPREEVGD